MCPDPIDDYDGYRLWCDLHICQVCEGVGEDWIEDGDGYGRHWICPACGGTGIDPAAL